MTLRAQLWERLASAGITHGPLPADTGDRSPWYVRAMLGIAAWLAAIFLLVFLGLVLSDVLRHATAAIVIGAVICSAAIVMLRIAGANIFVVQLAVAASLAGQGLIAFGLLEQWSDWLDAGPWIAIAAIEIVLIALARDYLHRVLSTLVAAVAVCLALRAIGWMTLAPALLAAAFVATQGNDVRSLARSAVWSPVATGLVLAMLLYFPFTAVWYESGFMRSTQIADLPPWLGAAALALVFVAAIARLLADASVAWTSRPGIAALLAGVVVALVAWPIPGIIIALLVLLLAFAASQRVLMGMAILALLYALGHYYYSLQSPLLVKAAALFATGVVLMGARFLVRLVVLREPEAGHA
jgi:hypothetical protein